ncbi:MAG: monothiol glutaredoxin [Gammaproteobacteria bacterium]|jgi:monothiol glutaredoxin
MSRQFLDENAIHHAAQPLIGGGHEDTIEEVRQALESSPVLIVGMAQNPVCKKVRKTLDAANISYQYIEYGSYFKDWPRRLALKMWSGWPTYPMVFVKGMLVGGSDEVSALLASGEIQQLLEPEK